MEVRCGQPFCVAVMRMLWPEKHVAVRRIAVIAGVSYQKLYRAAEAEAKTPRIDARLRRVSAAQIRSAWRAPDMSVPQAAATLGINPRTLWERAMAMGESPRKFGQPHRVKMPALFNEMWDAGVSIKEIMKACDPAPENRAFISAEVARRKLKPRRRGPQANGITLLQFFMAREARVASAAVASSWAMKEMAA